MNHSKSRWISPLLAVSGLLLIAAVALAQSNKDDKSKNKSQGGDQGSRQQPSGGASQRQAPPSGGNDPSSRQRNPQTHPDGSSTRQSDPSFRKSDHSTQTGADSGRKTDSKQPSKQSATQTGDHKSQTTDQKGKGDSNKQTTDRKNQNTDQKEKAGSNKGIADRNKPSSERETPKGPQPTLHTKQIANGSEKLSASGQVRERTEKRSDGEHTKVIAPTGRVQREVVEKPDGSKHTIQYAPNGHVQKTVVVAKDGTREATSVHYARGGKERATETIKVDARGREVSKTVVVKQTTVIVRNTTIINNTAIVRNYDRGRFGFAYRPMYVVHSPVFVSWYDPYWYGPRGVWVPHPFRYSWGWNDDGWYRWHRHYWDVYEVYPTPSYWVTDWMIAGYVADRYAATESVEQAREDARLAREDAEKARQAAEHAKEDAEIAEARAAESEAKARLAKAEALTAKAEAEEARIKSQDGRPNPNATPVDKETKEALRAQIEQAVAEKKEYAEQAAKGQTAVVPDLSKALTDPKHIYPVSSSINVISAADSSPAGTLTEGDLLRLEPGQEAALKDANENTLVAMRVMTSKGDEGEAKAGTVVNISLKSLQDFDSEFRAKLDLGLAEADKNKDQFKSGATKG